MSHQLPSIPHANWYAPCGLCLPHRVSPSFSSTAALPGGRYRMYTLACYHATAIPRYSHTSVSGSTAASSRPKLRRSSPRCKRNKRYRHGATDGTATSACVVMSLAHSPIDKPASLGAGQLLRPGGSRPQHHHRPIVRCVATSRAHLRVHRHDHRTDAVRGRYSRVQPGTGHSTHHPTVAIRTVLPGRPLTDTI